MNAKSWYLSRTIWAGLLTGLATLIKNCYGLDLTQDIGPISDYVLATVQFVGVAAAIIGRIKATQPIKPVLPLSRTPSSTNGLLLLVLACAGAVCGLSAFSN